VGELDHFLAVLVAGNSVTGGVKMDQKVPVAANFDSEQQKAASVLTYDALDIREVSSSLVISICATIYSSFTL